MVFVVYSLFPFLQIIIFILPNIKNIFIIVFNVLVVVKHKYKSFLHQLKFGLSIRKFIS